MRRRIRLSESTLHRIIKESVKRILKEAKNDFEPSKYQGKWSVYDKGSRTFSNIGIGKKKAFDKARELNDYCDEKDKEEKNESRILSRIIKESVRRILREHEKEYDTDGKPMEQRNWEEEMEEMGFGHDYSDIGEDFGNYDEIPWNPCGEDDLMTDWGNRNYDI